MAISGNASRGDSVTDVVELVDWRTKSGPMSWRLRSRDEDGSRSPSFAWEVMLVNAGTVEEQKRLEESNLSESRRRTVLGDYQWRYTAPKLSEISTFPGEDSLVSLFKKKLSFRDEGSSKKMPGGETVTINPSRRAAIRYCAVRASHVAKVLVKASSKLNRSQGIGKVSSWPDDWSLEAVEFNTHT